MQNNTRTRDGDAAGTNRPWQAIARPVLLLAIAMAGIGLYVYGATQEAVRRNTASDMEAVARLKAEQISFWLDERRDDIRSIVPPPLALDLQQWLAGQRKDPALQKRLMEQLQFRNVGYYRDISLHSAEDGKVLITSSGHPDLPKTRQIALESARQGTIFIEDIHSAEGMNASARSVGLFSPVFPPNGGGKPLAVVHVTMDPGQALFPLLDTWPGASPSGEILLLRREGNQLAYLNTPRHGGRSPSNVHPAIPLPGSTGKRLLQQGQGFIEGSDYRGTATLSFGLPAQGTPWFIMAKIDREEAYRPLNTIAGLSAALLAGLLVLCAWWLMARRRTDEALRQYLLEIEDLYQNAPCGYHSLDAKGNYIQINDTELAMLGYRREEIIGKKRVYDLLSPADQARFQEIYSRFKEQGWVKDLEIGLIRKDGSVATTLISATAIKDGEGRFVMTRSMVTDINDLKRAEEALRHSEFSLREAQRIAHVGSWQWEPATGRHGWSDECFRIFGLEPRSLEPDHGAFMDRILPEDGDAVGRWLERVQSGDQSLPRLDYRIRRADGEIRHIRGRVEISSPACPVLTVVGVQQDVTEQVETQARLAQITRLYAVLSKANQAVVRIHDRSRLLEEICRIAVEDGAFVMAWAGEVKDSRVVPVAHWGKEEGYLEQARILVADRKLGGGPTGTAIREGKHFICDDIATDPHMAPWRDLALARGYHSSAAFPIQEDGAVVGSINLYAPVAGFFTPEVVGLLDDLTADITFALNAHLHSVRRQAAEEKLRSLNEQLEKRVAERTRQLELANKELEAFSYSVSHDLRAPLRGIDGFSQVLLNRYADKLDDTGRNYLARVRRASQRMGELIDDLLNLSRVTRSKIRHQRVDLSALARTLLEDMQRMAPERRVRCTVQAGLQVWGDQGLLRIVLDNLLGNAWKFTGGTTEAEIEFGCREEDREEGKRLVYFVRDNGAGFDEAYADKLFQVFQRLHSDAEFEGTGIGLATVSRIIQRHRGEVWAEGGVGRGASFFFTLPRQEDELEACPPGEETIEIDRKESELS